MTLKDSKSSESSPHFFQEGLQNFEEPYYFNARWYDAGTGRFITEDPARDGLNWYSYVSNNPLKFIDPTGLFKFFTGFGGEDVSEHDYDGSKEQERDDIARAQLDARSDPDLQPNKKGDTFCNYGVQDTAEALDYDIDILQGVANDIYDSLDEASNVTPSSDFGKAVEVGGEYAQTAANDGQLVVAAMPNPGGHGHVVTVAPNDQEYDHSKGPLVNQIGSTMGLKTADETFGRGFSKVRYFVLFTEKEE